MTMMMNEWIAKKAVYDFSNVWHETNFCWAKFSIQIFYLLLLFTLDALSALLLSGSSSSSSLRPLNDKCFGIHFKRIAWFANRNLAGKLEVDRMWVAPRVTMPNSRPLLRIWKRMNTSFSWNSRWMGGRGATYNSSGQLTGWHNRYPFNKYDSISSSTTSWYGWRANVHSSHISTPNAQVSDASEKILFCRTSKASHFTGRNSLSPKQA